MQKESYWVIICLHSISDGGRRICLLAGVKRIVSFSSRTLLFTWLHYYLRYTFAKSSVFLYQRKSIIAIAYQLSLGRNIDS